MARARATSARTSRSKKVSIDFSNVGKMFEEDMEYPIIVRACSLEDGDAAPYFAFQFAGLDEDYAETIMYHNASTSPQSLWRLKPLLEALGMEIPEGPLDIDPAELIDLTCMCSTIKEKRPGGGSSIRPDEFWPLDDADKPAAKSTKSEDKSARGRRAKDVQEEPTIDLDAMSDDDIEKLAEEFSITGRTIDKMKGGLAKCDPAELAAACKDLDIELPGDEPEPPARGRRAAKAEKEEAPTGRRSRATKDEEEDEPKGKASGRSSRGSAKSKTKLTDDEVDEMSEEELEDLIAQEGLDLDLSEHRTLRKKKNAVKDALEAEGLLA